MHVRSIDTEVAKCSSLASSVGLFIGEVKKEGKKEGARGTGVYEHNGWFLSHQVFCDLRYYFIYGIFHLTTLVQNMKTHVGIFCLHTLLSTRL